MFTLKKQKGFTIVELLIVIVVIAILATLVIVTFTGIQRKARDSQRQTDINAVASHVEAFYAQYGYYPTLLDLQTASFQTSYLKGLDPQAMIDPKGTALAASTSATAYGYTATGSSGCNNTAASDPTGASTTNNGCDAFSVTATLESGGTYQKKSN
jgi:prepilin-type N-terminal cleavage/methylation domain-containing protein